MRRAGRANMDKAAKNSVNKNEDLFHNKSPYISGHVYGVGKNVSDGRA